MNRFPIRETGPLLCDLEGEFIAYPRKLKKGEEYKRLEEKKPYKIYVFKFRNREFGIGSRGKVLCRYWKYHEGKINEKEVYEVNYLELLVLVRYEKYVERKLAKKQALLDSYKKK